MNMEVFLSDGTSVILQEKQPVPLLQLYRQPHDIELYDNVDDRRFIGPGIWRDSNNRDNAETAPIPEVYRVLPDQTTPLYDWAIHLWRDMNPDLNDGAFASLLDNRLWLTNSTGWPGRRNIIQRRDLDKGFPTFHAPLVTGGILFKGKEVAETLYIENIRHDQPVSLEFVLERPWLWFYGTSVTSTGRVNMMTRNHRITKEPIPVRVPFITRLPARVPLTWLHKLAPGYVPNKPHKNVNKFALSSGLVEGSLE
jgi:hypothetical protein